MKRFWFVMGILLCVGLAALAVFLVLSSVDLPSKQTQPPVTTTAQTVATTEATEATTEATTLATEPVAETTASAETTVPAETTEEEEDNPFLLDSHHAFVYDVTGDNMLYQMGGIYDRVYPASLTKLFTALVVLEHMETTDTVTAGKEVELIDPDSTRAYIYEGQTITVGDCVKGMLMQSGNDAAYILAVACGRVLAQDPELEYTEALAVFIEEMNRAARMAGLYDTQFRTPDGIHDEAHYTTMADLTSFCRLALENPLIRESCATATFSVTYVSGQKAQWYNTNAQLMEESEYYNKYAIGLKTGTTNAAGACLLSAYEDGDSLLLIGVLGAEEKPSRYTDTKKLFDVFFLPAA